jgi:hypothetical protein
VEKTSCAGSRGTKFNGGEVSLKFLKRKRKIIGQLKIDACELEKDPTEPSMIGLAG